MKQKVINNHLLPRRFMFGYKGDSFLAPVCLTSNMHEKKIAISDEKNIVKSWHYVLFLVSVCLT